MIKTFFKHNIFAIFAFFFLIPVIALGFASFGGNSNYKDILKNGIEVEAEVIENSQSSTLEVNGVKYYSFDYKFVDESGYTRVGSTSETFTYSEVSDIMRRGTIFIKYDPDTYDSIESSYDPAKDKGKNTTTIFFVIFGIIDGIMIAVCINKGIRNLQDKKIAEVGMDYSATVTYINSTVRINEVPMFKVHYTWVGDNGTTMSGSSGSVYRRHEAEALEQAKTIDIKAIGKRSVIMTKPDMCLHNHYNNIADDVANQQRQEELKCDYCGHNISSKDEYCANCGARVNIYEQ